MKKNNNINMLSFFIEVVILTIFLFLMVIVNNFNILFCILTFIIYISIVVSEKMLILIFTRRKYLMTYITNDDEKIKLNDYLLLLITPDYFFTKIMKNKLQCYNCKKSKEAIRSYYISSCNTINVIISFIMAILLLIFFFLNLKIGETIVSLILIYRIISRCVEIIISFVNDVTSKKQKKSNLKNEDRIKLVFYSIFEICVFTFCTLLMNSNCYCDFLNSLFGSINVIINSFDNVDKLINKTLLSIESIACASLIGIVITTYISSNETSYNLNEKTTIHLKVYRKDSNGNIDVLFIPMYEINSNTYSITIDDDGNYNYELEFIDTNGNIVSLKLGNSSLLKQIKNSCFKYEFTNNGTYTLQLNKDGTIKIFLNDDKQG